MSAIVDFDIVRNGWVGWRTLLR